MRRTEHAKGKDALLFLIELDELLELRAGRVTEGPAFREKKLAFLRKWSPARPETTT